MTKVNHVKTGNTRKTLRSVFIALSCFALALTLAQMAQAQTNTFPSSGNAGIGTTTPTYPLDVLSSAQWAARFKKTDATHGGIIIDAAPGFNPNIALSVNGTFKWYMNNNVANGDTLQFWESTGQYPRFTLTQAGNVGIGTTAPLGKFHVVTPSYNNTAVPAWDSHFFLVGSDANAGSISLAYNQTTNTGYLMSLSPNVAWRNTVINPFGGNVGIGTTTPGSDVGMTGGLTLNGTGGTQLTVQKSGTTGLAVNVSETTSGDVNFYDKVGGSFSRSITLKSGSVGIGNTSPTEKLHVTGNGKITGNLTVDGVINAKYQDVAEWVPSSEQLVAGTVVVLDSTKSNQVISSTVSYDTRVAGVISAQPGITLGESGAGKVLVATTGRVRVKVDATRAPILIGDLLVTSDIPGVAMKSVPVVLSGVQLHRPGTLIGKALEPLAKGKGEILVLLSLQ